jgi:hypothetical protein
LSPSEPAQRGESRPTHDDFIHRLAAGDPSTLARCITLMSAAALPRISFIGASVRASAARR